MWKFRCLKGFATFLICCNVHGQVTFQERSSELNVVANYGSGTYGGGVSFCDFDQDGWDDITLASTIDEPLRFFRNTGGAFVEFFPNIPNDEFRTKQVSWVDYDNDGDKDLFVTSDIGLNKLYNNDGAFNMTDVTLSAGIISDFKCSGAAWGDINNDGYLDVFINKYDLLFEDYNLLFLNDGDGTFTNITLSSGLGTDSTLSLCSSFFDYNNDGYQDIYVANDRITNINRLYRNNGDNTFTDVSEESGTDVSMNAMSTAIEDYNNDGWQDIYITNTASTVSDPVGNALLMNNGDGTFTNMAPATGTTYNNVAWGAAFLDANLDTFNDLYVSSSSTVNTVPSSTFYLNQGDDTYIEFNSAGFENVFQASYASAIGDLNNDGLTDIIEMNDNFNVFVWENTTNTSNNFIKITLEGIQSNKDGIGSIIEIMANGKVQYRYTLCGEGYLGQNSTSEIIGLGTATEIDYVKVTWLSGIVDTLFNVSVNQTVDIVEGSTLSVPEEQIEQLHVYPNPVQDLLFLEGLNTQAEVHIYDNLGHIIYSTKVNPTINMLDVSQIPSGLYMLVVTFNGYQKPFKFIKG